MLLWLVEKLLFMDIKKKRMNIPMQKKTYSVVYKKFKKIKSPKRSYIFNKTFVISIICSNVGTINGKTCKEEETIETLKIVSLIDNVKRSFVVLNV